MAAMVGDFELANAISLRIHEVDGSTYVFVADFGGRIQVYDITALLYDPLEPIKLVETWSATKSLTDSLPSNVWDVIVDRAQWSSSAGAFDETYVYAAVERVGIEVLRFDPSCVEGQRLKKVALIQTPGNVRSMVLRDSGGDRSLLITDGEAGIRVLEYNF